MSISYLTKKIKPTKINEALIIKEIAQNSQLIIDQKIKLRDIANKTYMSHSTISRFIKRVGYKDWQDFVSSCKIEQIFYNKTKGGWSDRMHLQIAFLKQWLANRHAITDHIVSSIKSKGLTIFYGERISGNIAQNIALLLTWKNIKTAHYFFEQEMLPLLNHKTSLVILSASTRTNHQPLIDYALSKGAKVVFIDASLTDHVYQNCFHVKLPLVSHVKEDDFAYYLRSETIREFLVHVYQEV